MLTYPELLAICKLTQSTSIGSIDPAKRCTHWANQSPSLSSHPLSSTCHFSSHLYRHSASDQLYKCYGRLAVTLFLE